VALGGLFDIQIGIFYTVVNKKETVFSRRQQPGRWRLPFASGFTTLFIKDFFHKEKTNLYGVGGFVRSYHSSSRSLRILIPKRGSTVEKEKRISSFEQAFDR
jgi:hypothetical protein